MDSHPGTNQITLRKRLGFIRIASHTGTPLVPVYTFGETDLYYQVPNPRGSLLRSVQERILKVCKISTPIVWGRGYVVFARLTFLALIFFFSILPYAMPLYTVVGTPLPVPLRPNPTMDEMTAVHAEYMEALTDLFAKHHDSFYGALSKESQLSIVR